MANNLQQPNFFTDPVGYFREGAEKKAAGTTPDEYGVRNPGWFNDLVGTAFGATDEGTQQYIDKAKGVENKKEFKDVIEGLDGKFLPNQSRGFYIKERDRLIQERDANNFATSPQGLQFEETKRMNNAQLSELSSQNFLTNKRLDYQMEMERLNRADNLDIRAQEVGLQKDRLVFENQNLQADREFRKDQIHRESMMQLFAGLTNMAGLFVA